MKSNGKSLLFVFLPCLLLVLALTGCVGTDENKELYWASVTGSKLEKTEAGQDLFFYVDVDQQMLEQAVPISIQAAGSVQSGTLRLIMLDPNGSQVLDAGTFNGEGFTYKTAYLPKQTGKHSFGFAWDGPVTASYNISFQGFKLGPSILVPGLGMMLVAIAFWVYSLRNGSGWKYMGLGALMWVVTVAVKFAIAIPVNPLVYQALFTEGNLWSAGSLLFYLYVGAMTGVTEVLMVWLLLRYTRLGQVGWPKALGFAIGFGAFEALLLGLAAFTGAMIGLLSPETVASAMGAYGKSSNVLYGLAPIAERFATILVHVACNVLLFYGAQKRQWRWFWYSFLLKSLLDTVAGFAQMWGVETISKIWVIEGVILVFGLISWYWTAQLRKRYPQQVEAKKVEPAELEAQPV